MVFGTREGQCSGKIDVPLFEWDLCWVEPSPPKIHVYPEPQSVTLFGIKRVSADVTLSKKRSYCIKVGPHPMNGFLYEEKAETQEEHHVGKGADTRVVCLQD